MTYQITPVMLLNAAIFLFTTSLGLYAAFLYLRGTRRPVLVAFICFVFSISGWQVTSFFTHAVVSPAMKLLIQNIEAAVPATAFLYFLLWFTLEYTGTGLRFHLWIAGVATANVAGLIAVLFISPNFLYETSGLVTQGPVTVLGFRFGEWVILEREIKPAFRIYQLYAYSVHLVVGGILVRYIFQNRSDLYTGQVIALLLGITPPVVFNLTVFLGAVSPVWNTTSLFTGITAVGFAVAVFRYRLLRTVPVGRRQLVDIIEDPVFVLNSKDRVVDTNESGLRLFGIGEGWEGLPAEDFFSPLLSEDIRGIDDGTEISIEKKGKDFNVTKSPIRSVDGRSEGLVVLFQDITDQKDRERRLEKLNTRLQLALEETETGVWEWDIKNDEHIWDETTERLFGYEPGGFSGNTEDFIGRVHEEDVQTVQKEIDHAIDVTGSYRAEFRTSFPGGDQRWIQSRGVVEYDEEGDPQRMFGVQTDVTDLKQREQELKRYEQFIKNSSDEILHVSETGEVLYESPVPERPLGYIPGEQVGDNIFSYIHPDDKAGAIDKFSKVLNDPEAKTVEARLRLKDPEGEYRWTNVRGAKHTETEVGGVIITLREITDRIEQEQELRETKRRLERSNEQLEQFAYIASHDLQEPLRMVSGYLEFLEEDYGDELDKDAHRYIGFAVDGAKRMRNMVEGLLEYSRVESQNIEFEEVDTEEVLERVTRDLELLILENDAEVTYGDLPCIQGDSSQISQLFRNLIKNGIKYTEDGSPVVHIGADEYETEYEFFINDNGIGIPESEHRDVFEMFEQGTQGKDHDGTGIGLAISRRIVEKHGGGIRVESERGEGTTVYFTVPKSE